MPCAQGAAERHQYTDRALVDSLSAWLGVIRYMQPVEQSIASSIRILKNQGPLGRTCLAPLDH